MGVEETEEGETMKLPNRIMSWLLSPGAYALWHSMGNPEEWKWHVKNEVFVHKTNGLEVKMECWWRLPPPIWLIPFFWPLVPLSWALWPLFGFHCVGFDSAVGPIDRMLVAGRAMRLRTKLLKLARTSTKRKQNIDLLTKLTINQVAE